MKITLIGYRKIREFCFILKVIIAVRISTSSVVKRLQNYRGQESGYPFRADQRLPGRCVRSGRSGQEFTGPTFHKRNISWVLYTDYWGHISTGKSIVTPLHPVMGPLWQRQDKTISFVINFPFARKWTFIGKQRAKMKLVECHCHCQSHHFL